MNTPPKNSRPVTLEDLLRLKRAERPSPEFWTRFESELRAKQLAAIVAKRPWWRRMSPVTMLRHRLSLAAAAIVVFGFLSLEAFRSNSSAPQPAVASGAPSGDDSIVALNEETRSAGETISSSIDPVAMEGAQLVAVVQNSDRVNPADPASNEINAAGSRQVLSRIMAVESLDSNSLSPTELSVAANWKAAKAAHPELANRLTGLNGLERRTASANRQNVDPLAQMRPPSELHLRRLLASARPSISATVMPASDRVARRISEERLTEESIGRFDARGNEFSLKF